MLGSEQSSETNADPTDECRQAISIGLLQLETMKMNPAQYKLIAATNLIGGAIDPQVWNLTFKLRSLIPKSASEIGAGGEVFIEVDLSTKRARLLGYGE